jgi:SAM-dependent methyltransferase
VIAVGWAVGMIRLLRHGRDQDEAVRIDEVRSYWDANPLSAAAISFPLDSREYFETYDRLRERNESPEFSRRLHEYASFASKKVLDVGCGNGYVLSRYAQEGADVYGIDVTPTAIGLSERRFELLGLEGTFVVASAEDMPFVDGTFDCVCSMGVVHHTPDTEKAVAEIFRVLKPGGRLILMVYHRNSVLYQVNFRAQSLIRRKSMRELVNEVDGVGNPKGDVYSRRELQALLARFERVEMFVRVVQGWMVSAKAGHLIPDRLLRPLERRWGWFLYAQARKPG